MWRKCGRVSAMGHLAACFRRTWEIKTINICSLSAVPTPPCPLSGVHGVHVSMCLSTVRPAGRCACAFSLGLPEVSPETLPLPPTEVTRILGKRAHKSHALTLVQKVVSLWPPAPVVTGSSWVRSSDGMCSGSGGLSGLQASLRLVSAAGII